MPEDIAPDDLYSRLARGPAFLMLGQRYLALETGSDPFLTETLRKFGADAPGLGYNRLFSCRAGLDRKSTLSWMLERCQRLPAPDWLDNVAKVYWSGVYTSAIDSIWLPRFRTDERRLDPIFNERKNPPDARSTTELHTTHLFGRVDQFDADYAPPLDEFEFERRRPISMELMRRLPHLMTPLGSLMIEGYAGENDWLDCRDLYAALADKVLAGQVYIFSCTPEIRENVFIQRLAAERKVRLFDVHLAEVVAAALRAGLMPAAQPSEDTAARTIFARRAEFVMAPDLFRRANRSATVLTKSMRRENSELTPNIRYDLFREFLAVSAARPLWPAYAAGLWFPRDFESQLNEVVEARLNLAARGEEHSTEWPVIVHGASGTGKSVALAATAWRLLKLGEVPVLYIERRSLTPAAGDVEAFCEWAEEHNAPTTVIVWDGMVEQDQYTTFLRTLTGRGRRVLLIGSAYSIPTTRQRKRTERFISAPIRLSPKEIGNFEAFLKSFDPTYTIDSHMVDSTFLSALYRLLPETRMPLKEGLAGEVQRAHFVAQEWQAKFRASALEQTTLGAVLIAASRRFPGGSSLLIDEGYAKAHERAYGSVKDLINLVMVPAQFGLSVPFDLLLRTVEGGITSESAELLQTLDIFSWPAGPDSLKGRAYISVGARGALEAELIVRSRLGTAADEMTYIRRLLIEIRGTDLDPQNPEVDFAVDLLQKLGAGAVTRYQNEQNRRFRRFGADLAAVLEELREVRGQQIPRLMLQEASLIRRAAVHESKIRRQTKNIDAEFLRAFENKIHRALTVSARALELLGPNEANHRELRSYLLVELAAAKGALNKNSYLLPSAQVGGGEGPSAARSLFSEAKQDLQHSQRLNPGGYYQLDVLAWASLDMLNAGQLSIRDQLETQADLDYAFRNADTSEYSLKELEQYYARLHGLGRFALRDIDERTFRQLEAQGSTAGYYVRALGLSGILSARRGSTPPSSAVRLAYDFLVQAGDRIRNDSRCLDLLVELWWRTKTGEAPCGRKRVPIWFSDEDWRALIQLTTDALRTRESRRRLEHQYLRAVGLWHLRDYALAGRAFSELSNEPDALRGRRRLTRYYLVGDSRGTACVFHGIVSDIKKDFRSGRVVRGSVRVEELGETIPFSPWEFREENIAPDCTLDAFRIGFNFIGPIAEPASAPLEDAPDEA